jgi:hypothetical protein
MFGQDEIVAGAKATKQKFKDKEDVYALQKYGNDYMMYWCI